MKPKLYICLKYEKNVKFISDLRRHMNAKKISLFLIYCQLFNSDLDYNTINLLNFLLNKKKEDATSEVLNYYDLKKKKHISKYKLE